MKLDKLNFQQFEDCTIPFSSLKSLTGGAVGATDPGTAGEDFIDKNEGTHYACKSTVYNDSCGPTQDSSDQ